MTDDIWKVKQTDEVWIKTWLKYDRDGRTIGAGIKVQNGSPELIEAIKKAFDETEGQKRWRNI